MERLCAAREAHSRFLHGLPHNVRRLHEGNTTMRYWLAALSILAAVGCAATAPKDALYRDLGGTEGITKLVDAFFPRLNSDARINTLFRNVDHDDLRRL